MFLRDDVVVGCGPTVFPGVVRERLAAQTAASGVAARHFDHVMAGGVVETYDIADAQSLARNFGFQARLSSDFRDLGPVRDSSLLAESYKRLSRPRRQEQYLADYEKMLVCRARYHYAKSSLAKLPETLRLTAFIKAVRNRIALQLKHTFASSHRKQAY